MTEDTPNLIFRARHSGTMPACDFWIGGSSREYAIVCVDHLGQPFVLVDEGCGHEDIRLPGGIEAGRDIMRLLKQADQGSKAAQDRLTSYAVEGIMIARGLREGANDNVDLGRAA